MKRQLSTYYQSSSADDDRYHRRKAQMQEASYEAVEKTMYRDRRDYSGTTSSAGVGNDSNNIVSPTRRSSKTIEDYSQRLHSNVATTRREEHIHSSRASENEGLDHLAYSIEYLDEAKQEESKLSMVAPRVRIRFNVAEEK